MQTEGKEPSTASCSSSSSPPIPEDKEPEPPAQTESEPSDDVPSGKAEAQSELFAFEVAISEAHDQLNEEAMKFRATFPHLADFSNDELLLELATFNSLTKEDRLMYVKRHHEPVASFVAQTPTEKKDNVPLYERPKTFKKGYFLPDNFEFEAAVLRVYESTNLHSYPEMEKMLVKSLNDIFKDLEITRPVIPRKDNLTTMVGRRLGENTKNLLDSVLPGNNARLDLGALLTITAIDLMEKARALDVKSPDGLDELNTFWSMIERLLFVVYDISLATAAHNVRTARDIVSKGVGLSHCSTKSSHERQQSYFQSHDLAQLQVSLEQQKIMRNAAIFGKGNKRGATTSIDSSRAFKRQRWGGYRGRGGRGGGGSGRGGGRPFRGRGSGRGRGRFSGNH